MMSNIVYSPVKVFNNVIENVLCDTEYHFR